MSRLKWTGYVNRMDSKGKVSKLFKNNLQRSGLKGGPKRRWWIYVETDIKKWKITNWKQRLKNWEKSRRRRMSSLDGSATRRRIKRRRKRKKEI